MSQIQLIQGDITVVETDAIVNAANSSLLGGGGVDGAIHKKGGPSILKECMEIRERQGGCMTGDAVITTAGNLPAKYVIHTVGPVWTNSHIEEKEKQLSNCYVSSLNLAVDHQLKSIAFPNISTGIYQFPKERAAKIAINTVRDFMSTPSSVERCIFVCFDTRNFELYKRLMDDNS